MRKSSAPPGEFARGTLFLPFCFLSSPLLSYMFLARLVPPCGCILTTLSCALPALTNLAWRVGQKRERQLKRDRVRAGASDLQHIPEVYTNGSYAEEARGVGFAGCGVWFGPLDPRSMSFHLPGVEQTNNRAELSASIAALRAMPAAQPLCVVTDSQYVYDGATARLPCWLLLGRNIPHLDLWDELRAVISSRTAPTHWRHVYSHVGVLGNERADSLANQGRLDHPACLQFLREQRARKGLPPVTISP